MPLRIGAAAACPLQQRRLPGEGSGTESPVGSLLSGFCVYGWVGAESSVSARVGSLRAAVLHYRLNPPVFTI